MPLSGQYKQPLLLFVAILFAIAYAAVPVAEGSIPYITLKAGGCFLLALFAFLNIPAGRIQKAITLALLASCLGDIFLAIRSADYFVQGLGAFLIAHLIYISAFVRAKGQPPLSMTKKYLVVITLFSAVGIILALWPYLGALKAPVCLYIIVISLMTLSAIYSHFQTHLIVGGAFCFMISDAMIAVNKFIVAIPLAGLMIWATYFAAQLFILFAIINHTRRKTTSTT